VVDAFCEPLDAAGPLDLRRYSPRKRASINPLSREPITELLETGVRAVDCLLTIGRGQRVGVFAGSGVGKSTLLGMMARNISADVNVIALIGERGREVWDFIRDSLGEDGLKRSVVVVATADQPALVRTHAMHTATAIAESFRDSGKHVLLIADSITRFAMAQREIGLAIGEPPTTRGYTPSVFGLLPQLLERCGNFKESSITAVYSVLVEGDDMNEPVADHMRAILDGHFVLSRDLATRGHYPAIEVTHSISRLLPALVPADDCSLARRAVELIARVDNARDLIDMGAYHAGSNLELDFALEKIQAINALLRQRADDPTSRGDAMRLLAEACAISPTTRDMPREVA
jgi:flagellum-specific ATP synthase